MVSWNPIFQRHIPEHPRLQLLIVSSQTEWISPVGLDPVFAMVAEPFFQLTIFKLRE
jgi:hypothetical protein